MRLDHVAGYLVWVAGGWKYRPPLASTFLSPARSGCTAALAKKAAPCLLLAETGSNSGSWANGEPVHRPQASKVPRCGGARILSITSDKMRKFHAIQPASSWQHTPVLCRHLTRLALIWKFPRSCASLCGEFLTVSPLRHEQKIFSFASDVSTSPCWDVLVSGLCDSVQVHGRLAPNKSDYQGPRLHGLKSCSTVTTPVGISDNGGVTLSLLVQLAALLRPSK